MDSVTGSRCTCLSVFVVVVLTATHLVADIISPIGLAPGSRYLLIFATVGTLAPSSTDIEYYNTFVTNQAALDPSLPSAIWHAVASTASVAANVNAPSAGLPVYNTQGIEVASSATGLYTSILLNTITSDQFGNEVRNAVFTGSDTFGQPISGATLGMSSIEYGIAGATSYWWSSAGTYTGVSYTPEGTFEPSNVVIGPASFYALSTPITVPAPEPTTITLLGSALFLIGGHHFLRRWRGLS